MTDAQRTEYVARDDIMKLLSNEEVAKVSIAEDARGLTDGGEYLDLEHLDQGIQPPRLRLRLLWDIYFHVAQFASKRGIRLSYDCLAERLSSKKGMLSRQPNDNGHALS